MSSVDAHDKNSRHATVHLGLLFALIYFVQGLAEPSEGLIAQPVRSLLSDWKKSPTDIANFMALIAIPWAIKPLYGLMIDFVPLLGSRRRNYLLLSTLATSASLIWLGCKMPDEGRTGQLLLLLIAPTLAVAFSDVVIDALMVEKGQALGMTGRLQSIQWGSMYAATVLTGSLGGWLAEHQRQEFGFLLCGVGGTVSLVATWFWIHDASAPKMASSTAPVPSRERETFRGRLLLMRQTLTDRRFLIVGAFLFLWNFNPFSSTIQQLHMTQQLELTNQQYGHTLSLFALGSIGACLFYGLLCRSISPRGLIHLAIAAGVLSTLGYLWVEGYQSAIMISVFVGFVYMLGNLIQMDLAARMCPPAIAGSMFAMLMSISNIALILSSGLGGRLYEFLGNANGPAAAYTSLIAIGSATTAFCWAFTPWLMNDRQPS